jgi:hypothetical protein
MESDHQSLLSQLLGSNCDTSDSESSHQTKQRSRIPHDVLEHLNGLFTVNPSPTPVQRRQIAKYLNMDEKRVQIWFQNRRAKVKQVPIYSALKVSSPKVDSINPVVDQLTKINPGNALLVGSEDGFQNVGWDLSPESNDIDLSYLIDFQSNT